MYTRPINDLGYLLNRMKWHLIFYSVYVLAVYVAHAYLGIKELDIKMSIATVLGFSVALLLGFRTASAYERWWEARKIWGAIVNDSRTLIRQAMGFTSIDPVLSEVKQLAKYQIAWCITLSNILRKLNSFKGIKEYLTDQEKQMLSTKNNVPNEILKLMEILLAQLRKEGKLGAYEMVSLDQTIKNLCDAMGKCERIKNTVFPVQYRTFTHTGIMIFAAMLPYGMLLSTGPFVVVICLIVMFFFLMIETIAFYLQDPFQNRASDIPMSALSRTIEINLLELINEEHIPEGLEPNDSGVLM